MDQVATGVRIWWIFLCSLTLFNLGFWIASCVTFMRRRVTAPRAYTARWPHVLLSLTYVLGCGFRSILPRADVQRMCLYDSFLSSVLVGRSVATIAELAFAVQWALLLYELSQAEHDRFGMRVARVVVPLIFVAEICSWYAVLTTNYLGNAMEQSIWTFSAALMTVALFGLWKKTYGQLRGFLTVAMIVCVGFVCFMCTVDVPMYLTRFQADLAHGRPFLSLGEGLRDVSERWVVIHSWQEWRDEISWMSLYFSVAVWVSISLVHAPHSRRSFRSSLFGKANSGDKDGRFSEMGTNPGMIKN
ncbi:MAG: hypothetical protein QM778_14815 [Myxococcales bacterium]